MENHPVRFETPTRTIHGDWETTTDRRKLPAPGVGGAPPAEEAAALDRIPSGRESAGEI
jgi:hypothetical protein